MTSTTRSFPPVRELALFLSLCFFWGTTWIGIKYSLMSLPPVVHWRYDWTPEPGTPEATLYSDFLRPRDWLGQHP